MSKSLEAIVKNRAIKRYVEDFELSQEQKNEIIECMRMTPSSHGMEPVKVLWIENKELRSELSEAWFDQKGMVEGSVLILWIGYREKYLLETHFKKQINKKVAPEFTEYKEKKYKAVANMSNLLAIGWDEWVARQAYIMMGVALTTISEIGLHSCPTEGFKPQEAEKILSAHKLIDLENEKLIAGMFVGKYDESKQKLREKSRISINDFCKTIK